MLAGSFLVIRIMGIGTRPSGIGILVCIVDRQPLMYLRSYFGGQHVVGAWIQGADDTIHGGMIWDASGFRVTTPPLTLLMRRQRSANLIQAQVQAGRGMSGSEVDHIGQWLPSNSTAEYSGN